MLRRTIITQVALATILVGLVVILVGGAPRRPEPQSVRSVRPATEQERREADRQLLIEEMDRLRESLRPTPR